MFRIKSSIYPQIGRVLQSAYMKEADKDIQKGGLQKRVPKTFFSGVGGGGGGNTPVNKISPNNFS